MSHLRSVRANFGENRTPNEQNCDQNIRSPPQKLRSLGGGDQNKGDLRSVHALYTNREDLTNIVIAMQHQYIYIFYDSHEQPHIE